jgi:hypothetical protein
MYRSSVIPSNPIVRAAHMRASVSNSVQSECAEPKNIDYGQNTHSRSNFDIYTRRDVSYRIGQTRSSRSAENVCGRVCLLETGPLGCRHARYGADVTVGITTLVLSGGTSSLRRPGSTRAATSARSLLYGNAAQGGERARGACCGDRAGTASRNMTLAVRRICDPMASVTRRRRRARRQRQAKGCGG